MVKQHKRWYAANRERQIASARAWVLANPERVRENQKRWKAANKDKHRELNRKHRLKKAYGLTPEAWEQMFEDQGRACKCCGSPDPKVKNGWHVDHCHTTGLVRGILCQPCNVMLGCAGDNPAILRKGAEYLMFS